MDDRVLSEKEKDEEYITEDDSSDNKNVVLLQGRNKWNGPDNQSNANTDKRKEE